jgi:transcriptional regulator with XRE-family HTH domain
MGYGEEIKQVLGRNIANARRDARLNQRELAKQIGVSPQMLCQIEAGKKQVPDDLMKQICTVLKLHPKDLLTGRVWHEPMNAPGIEVVLRFDSDEDHVDPVELLQPYLQLDEDGRKEVRHLIDVLHLKKTMARIGKVTDAFSEQKSGDIRKVKTKGNC